MRLRKILMNQHLGWANENKTLNNHIGLDACVGDG